MIHLRPYQHEAADAALAACERNQRPAIVLPTGTGKTTVIAELARRAELMGTPTLVLAHRVEIVEQIAERLRLHCTQPVGVEASAKTVARTRFHTAAMVQTLRNDKRLGKVGRPGMIIVDECHHATAASYQTILGELGAFHDTRTPTIGFTATLSRGDSARLSDTWDEVAYSKSILWAIEAGYLVRPRGKSVVMNIDLAGVRSSGGDYQDDALGEVIGAEVESIVKAWHTHGEQRKTMAFVPNINSAHALAEEFQNSGVPAAVVIGSTGVLERAAIYGAFAAGSIRVLVSVSVLTEGFDMPAVSCVLMARPTKLAHVYVQAVGRGLRPAPDAGKTDCLVLDVVGVSRIHSLITLDDLGTAPEYERVSADGDLDDEVIAEMEAIDDDPVMRRVEALEDVDLFHDSETLWLRTHRGVRFIPGDGFVVFIWPAGEDVYRVGHIGVKSTDNGGSWLPGQGDLDQARTAAEGLADQLGVTYATRSASWRQGRAPASLGQQRKARQLGIMNPETYPKAKLSDQISIVLASNRLDRALP